MKQEKVGRIYLQGNLLKMDQQLAIFLPTKNFYLPVVLYVCPPSPSKEEKLVLATSVISPTCTTTKHLEDCMYSEDCATWRSFMGS